MSDRKIAHLTDSNPEMDVRLLDSIKDVAADTLTRLEQAHGKVIDDEGNRVSDPNWTEAADDHWKAYTILTPELIGTALTLGEDEKITIPRSVKAAIEMFLLTEDGIAWYPRDVGNIFNPLHIVPADYKPGQVEDPHEIFVRDWVAQEGQHAAIEETVALVMGVDMIRLEASRYKYVRSDLLPKPINTPQGAAYTALQENNTRTPYSNLIVELDKLVAQARAEGKDKHADVIAAAKDVYRHVRSDENRHHLFIRDNLLAATQVDDPEIASYAVAGMYDQYVATDFMMPGESIDRFRRLSAPIARAGIFTVEQSMANKHDMIKRAQLDKLEQLTDVGKFAVAGLLAEKSMLEETYGLAA